MFKRENIVESYSKDLTDISEELENFKNKNELTEQANLKLEKILTSVHQKKDAVQKWKVEEFKRAVRRIVKVLLFILIIKMLRRYLVMREEVQNFFSTYETNQLETFLTSIAILLGGFALVVLVARISYIVYLKKPLIYDAIFLSCLTFIVADLSMLFLFPEITLSVILAILNQ